MNHVDPHLTSTNLLTAATEALLKANFHQIPESVTTGWSTLNCRLFEDEYSIVAVVVYETWNELSSSWPDVQGK